MDEKEEISNVLAESTIRGLVFVLYADCRPGFCARVTQPAVKCFKYKHLFREIRIVSENPRHYHNDIQKK